MLVLKLQARKALYEGKEIDFNPVSRIDGGPLIQFRCVFDANRFEHSYCGILEA